MNGFIPGLWLGAALACGAMYWHHRRAVAAWRARHEEAVAHLAVRDIDLDILRRTLRVGRAVYSLDFLATFPTLRGHFRMAGPVTLPGGRYTCEIGTTTHLVRGAASHLSCALGTQDVAREMVGKALALLDLADAEVAAKQLLDGVKP